MRGTDATTGKAISGLDHLRQSIRDILTTPIGSRVMRRTYGSRLLELVDAPTNRSTILEIMIATVEALLAWEPRIKVDRVQVSAVGAGKITLDLYGTYIPEGNPIVIPGLVVS